MSKKINLVGRKFGRFTVINNASTFSKHTKWVVKCECGVIKNVFTTSLLSGRSNSCGCLARELAKKNRTGVSPMNKKEKGESSFNNIFLTYKRNAKKRNLSFNLEKNKFKNIIDKNCYYCNSPPAQTNNKKGSNGDYVYNGIDRLNPYIGYESSNCVPCCSTCNYAKLKMTETQFLQHVEKIYLYKVKSK